MQRRRFVAFETSKSEIKIETQRTTPLPFPRSSKNWYFTLQFLVLNELIYLKQQKQKHKDNNLIDLSDVTTSSLGLFSLKWQRKIPGNEVE